MKSSLPTASLS